MRKSGSDASDTSSPQPVMKVDAMNGAMHARVCWLALISMCIGLVSWTISRQNRANAVSVKSSAVKEGLISPESFGSQQTLVRRLPSAENWSTDDRPSREKKWTAAWARLPKDKDWYHADRCFLDAVLPRLPKGARVLELSCGRGTIAEGIQRAGTADYILSTDIVQTIVWERRSRRRPKATSASNLDFAVVDALNLELPTGTHVDVVVEKAGVVDMNFHRYGVLRRMLTCIVTKAFDPVQGGVFIALAKEPHDDLGFSSGLAAVVHERPELNCTIAEDFFLKYVIIPYLVEHQTGLRVWVVQCGGVTMDFARSNCDVQTSVQA